MYDECLCQVHYANYMCNGGKISPSARIHRYWNCASWCIPVYHYFVLL